MRRKKLLSIALSLVTVATLMAGCAGNAANNSTDDTTPPSGQQNAEATQTGGNINLQWALWDRELTAYYQPLIDAYVAKNPNISIEMIDLGSADYTTMLSTQLSGGASLDIVTIKDMPSYVNLARQNHLEPIDSFVASSGIDTSLYNGVTEQLIFNDNLYALPFRSDFWLIFYNKDLFDAQNIPYPPNDMSLTDYDELSRKLVSGSGANKVFGAHYHTWRSAVQLFGILDGKNTIIDGSYDFLAPYYELILKKQDDGIVQDYATLKTSGTHYSGVFFNNQVAMMNMGSWFIATQIAKVEDGESLSKNWGIVKYPSPDGVPEGTTLGVITALSVNTKSANKAEALDFMKFVTGPEGASIIATTGTIPAILSDEVIDTISSIDGFPTDLNSREALFTTRAYLEMPLHERSADIEMVLNEAHDNIMTKNSSIEEGIRDMNTKVTEILNR